MPRPCRMIPPTGAHAAQLLGDCQTFSRYVADAGFVPPTRSGAPALTSALHVEMSLWKPTSQKIGRRYHANDAEHNAWWAMQQMGIVGTFSTAEITAIFVSIRTTFPKLLPGQCARSVFDAWHFDLINGLRVQGLAKSGAIGATDSHKPTTLATVGLAQKVVNIYLKYALCWELAGRFQGGTFVPSILIPGIADFICALHAPIDSILLNSLRDTALGKDWIESGVLDRYRARIQQVDSTWSPWSKLDSPETYLAVQSALRAMADESWTSCSCDGEVGQSEYPGHFLITGIESENSKSDLGNKDNTSLTNKMYRFLQEKKRAFEQLESDKELGEYDE